MIDLSVRNQAILKSLIELYIDEGEPVGSKHLVETKQLGLSSATIRNTMSELEDLGLICSPHTSSGRVPTARGYRLFVDSLLVCGAPSDSDLSHYTEKLQDQSTPKGMVKSVSQLLANMSQLAGVVTMPKVNLGTLRHIEFLPLSDHKVLVILVLNKQEVQNRVIDLEQPISRSVLEKAGNYLMEHYQGVALDKIREDLIQKMTSDRRHLDEGMAGILHVAHQSMQGEPSSDCVVSGHNNLLSMVDETGVDRLKQLLDAFGQKKELLDLFDRCMGATGIQVFIGEESGIDWLSGCSVVTAPYVKDQQTVGVLGVVGPTRMPYSMALEVVNLSSKIASLALKSK